MNLSAVYLHKIDMWYALEGTYILNNPRTMICNSLILIEKSRDGSITFGQEGRGNQVIEHTGGYTIIIQEEELDAQTGTSQQGSGE